MILQGLKPRIFDQLNKSGRKWLQELPAVVWSLRTTPSRATGFTLFFLVHGAEAVLPTDLEYGSPRVRGYDEDANQRAREDSLDQLDEARLVALMHSAWLLTVKIRQPSHEFTFGVGITFVSYSLVLTPVV
jgi:hypothetical protein